MIYTPLLICAAIEFVVYPHNCTFMWGLFLILGFLAMDAWMGKNWGACTRQQKKKQWMVTLYNQFNAVQCLLMFDKYDCFLNVFGDV